MYIHQHKNWPNFIWNDKQLIHLLGKVRNYQGKLIGQMLSFGFDLKAEASFETLALDILKSNEIEGEHLDDEQVRSSLARRLGIPSVITVASNRNVEGVVDMVLEAIQNYKSPLSIERICDWHFALFPTGKSGRYSINVGSFRDDANGPMQVVSGAMGREVVHFEAPTATQLSDEMIQFTQWINHHDSTDDVLKAAIAHLWFITLHPFDDGNGRIARTLTDMLLTRSDDIPQRFYSMSAAIQADRKGYYAILESTQKGTLDITEWLTWFLNCLLKALHESDTIINKVVVKHHFWLKHNQAMLNARQSKIINMLLDGFKGKLTSSKWAKINKCSRDTALRDITDLIAKNILKKEDAGGRSTNYELIIQ